MMADYVCTCQAAFGGEVVHCPRHDAADEMYDMLDLVIQEVHNAGRLSTKTIKEVAETLALADGDA